MALQINIQVTDQMLAIMRKSAEGNSELENLSDEALVKWVEEAAQSDFENGDTVADYFDY